MREVEAASSTRWRIYPTEIIFDNADAKVTNEIFTAFAL